MIDMVTTTQTIYRCSVIYLCFLGSCHLYRYIIFTKLFYLAGNFRVRICPESSAKTETETFQQTNSYCSITHTGTIKGNNSPISTQRTLGILHIPLLPLSHLEIQCISLMADKPHLYTVSLLTNIMGKG